MDEERDPMTDPKNNPAIPGSPLIKRDDLDMTDPKNNPHIPRDFEEEKPPDNPPGMEGKTGPTLPELLANFKGESLRFGFGLFLRREGNETEIWRGGQKLAVEDLEPHEAKGLRTALLEEETKS